MNIFKDWGTISNPSERAREWVFWVTGQMRLVMKKEIHPRWYGNCKVYYNGEVVMTCGATVQELHVDVWSGSHPFFTGKSTFVDSAGRVEKFNRKFSGGYFKGGKK